MNTRNYGSISQATVRKIMKRIISVSLLVVLLGLLLRPADPAAAGGASTGSSLRLMTYNTAFMVVDLPAPFGILDTNDGKFGGLDYPTRADHIADAILRDDNDVVALNEVFSDEAKAILVGKLSGKYSHYISKIKGDAPNPLVSIIMDGVPAGVLPADTNDSGLMLFSKHQFVTFSPTAKPYYIVNKVEGNWGASAQELSVITYKDSNGMDGLASKAVAMVRIKNPNDNQISNIAFTHLQATYGSPDPDGEMTRKAQLASIKELITSSLTPQELKTQPVFMMGDLNVIGQNKKTPGGEWATHFLNANNNTNGFFACGGANGCTYDPNQKTGTFMTDSWGFETSTNDKGISNNIDNARLDYILHNNPDLTDFSTKPITRARLCMQHIMIANELVDQTATGDQQLSDHFGVRVDFNKRAPHCSPNDDAGLFGPQPIVFAAGSNQDQSFTPAVGATITFPGSMQWYRIDKAGSYSIKVSNNPANVDFQVYGSKDLSRPLAPWYGETKGEHGANLY